jgi:hypothetical protein
LHGIDIGFKDENLKKNDSSMRPFEKNRAKTFPLIFRIKLLYLEYGN